MQAQDSRAKVLLIVGEEQIGSDLSDALESLGYSVTDVITSVDRPLRDGPDISAEIVILDLELKAGLDPIAAGQLIRTRCDRPVIYLADDADQAKRVALLGAGSPYVMWPFLPYCLHDAIQEVIASCKVSVDPVYQ